MKKFYFFSIIFFSIQLCFSQTDAVGCGGTRYIEDVFSDYDISTIQYGENINSAGETQKLFMDVYQPKGDDLSKRPLVIWAFGGSFISGNRASMIPLCIEYAKKGYVAATIDYRLITNNGQTSIPDSLDMADAVVKAMGDMKAAIRFFRKDAATGNIFRIDPNNIISGGVSAGSITSLHAAYLQEGETVPPFLQTIIDNNGGLEGTSGDADNLTYSSKVKAVINFSGGLYKMDWIDNNDPPLISFHGTNDETVPFDLGVVSVNIFGFRFEFLTSNGSNRLHKRADEINMKNAFMPVEGGGHSDIYTLPKYASQREAFNVMSKAFLKEVICSETVPTQEILAELIELKAFPNPSNAQMRIELKSASSNLFDLMIFDNLGRRIRNIQGKENFTISKEDIGTGIFNILISSKDKTYTRQQKIIFF